MHTGIEESGDPFMLPQPSDEPLHADASVLMLLANTAPRTRLLLAFPLVPTDANGSADCAPSAARVAAPVTANSGYRVQSHSSSTVIEERRFSRKRRFRELKGR